MKRILGIDAGGTSSELCYFTNNEVIRLKNGPACVFQKHEGEQNLEHLCSHIRTELGRNSLDDPDRIRASVAGCASDIHAARAKAELSRNFPEARIEVFSDVAAAFMAGHGNRSDGAMVLICGTGSVLAYAFGGKLHVLGGYGPAVDEYGSARLITRQALTLAAGLIDRNQSDDLLLSRTRSAGLNCSSRNSFLDSLYKQEEPFHKLIAPIVLDLAASGHVGCLEIVSHHTKELAAVVGYAAGNMQPDAVLALHGGLFRHPFFKETLTAKVAKQNPDVYILTELPDVAHALCTQQKSVPLPFYSQS